MCAIFAGQRCPDGFSVQGSGLRVQGSGCRVQGSGCRVRTHSRGGAQWGGCHRGGGGGCSSCQPRETCGSSGRVNILRMLVYLMIYDSGYTSIFGDIYDSGYNSILGDT